MLAVSKPPLVQVRDNAIDDDHLTRRNGVTQTTSSVDDTVDSAKEAVADTAQQAARKAEEVRGTLRQRARREVDERSTTVGEQAGAVGQAMRDMSGQLRSEGLDLPARMTDEAAARIERLGGYLRASDAERILGDVEAFGRRQPWVVAAAGLAVGVAAARFLKASGRRRAAGRGPAPRPPPPPPPDPPPPPQS